MGVGVGSGGGAQRPCCPSFAASNITMTAPLRFRYDFSLWYCLDDHSTAMSICEMLTKQGFRGYVEHEDCVAGRSLISSAVEVVQSSWVAIVLLTARSVADPWCLRIAEWNLFHAIEQERTKVIPIYVDIKQEQVPLALRHLSGLDYNHVFFWDRLLNSLQKTRRQVTTTLHPTSVTRAQR